MAKSDTALPSSTERADGADQVDDVSRGSSIIEVSPPSLTDPALERLARTARGYAEARDSANTARAYQSDWTLYARWCRRRGLDADAPDSRSVGLYLTALAAGDGTPACTVSTIERKLASIVSVHRGRGTPLDRRDRHIASVMAGIRRTHARPPRQKEAVLGDDLLAMAATLPGDLRGLRDRAILLLGFAGALRRSEIVGLDRGPDETKDGSGWIEILPPTRREPGGLVLTLQGKTGWRTVEVGRGSSDRTCPVATLETWLRLGKIAHGPLFRAIATENGPVGVERLSDKHVARLVQKTARAAGIRGDMPEGDRRLAFAGHSLRAGLATAADADEAHVQRQLGHASAEMTRTYKRSRERFRINLTRAAGL